MAARTVLSNRLRQMAEGWAFDPLRPAQLKTFLTSLADHPSLDSSAVEAVRALRDNRLAKQCPTPESIMKPASRPFHYERIAEGYAKSLQGIGRPWWKIFFGIW
ncbi:hypothetical protein K488DRAFT_53306 [Vararia minispora EC-137]|uniref:Uncharacterized protein n=1 Tax=Vararia minispora EC-137 TaxID=1314806 RepID=A0ACB8QGQ3_9AGAM|nr:hypothetical protein K488DRAFT_53306 [Vararia minispora EC-137]